MRRFLSVLIGVLTFGMCFSQDEDGFEPILEDVKVALPFLSEGLELDLGEGVIVPGSSLLGSVARDLLFSGDDGPLALEPIIEEELEPEIEEWPTEIAENFHEAYFRQPPSGFLVDPQNLLTPQEKRDREGFFAYHAEDSSIDIYFYLFDSRQQLPEEESPERVMSEQVQDLGPSLVVFYYLGMPERTQLVFSPFLERSAKDLDKRNALVPVVEEALDRSEEVAQIESFSVQLSIRLYWMEKELGNFVKQQSSLIHPLSDKAPVFVEKLGGGEKLQRSALARNVFGGVMILALAGGVGFFAKWFADRKRIFVFPESEGSLLLEAPHAAGVGALIAYDSPSFPPSLQKDEVPDYLQRM